MLLFILNYKTHLAAQDNAFQILQDFFVYNLSSDRCQSTQQGWLTVEAEGLKTTYAPFWVFQASAISVPSLTDHRGDFWPPRSLGSAAPGQLSAARRARRPVSFCESLCVARYNGEQCQSLWTFSPHANYKIDHRIDILSLIHSFYIFGPLLSMF